MCVCQFYSFYIPSQAKCWNKTANASSRGTCLSCTRRLSSASPFRSTEKRFKANTEHIKLNGKSFGRHFSTGSLRLLVQHVSFSVRLVFEAGISLINFHFSVGFLAIWHNASVGALYYFYEFSALNIWFGDGGDHGWTKRNVASADGKMVYYLSSGCWGNKPIFGPNTRRIYYYSRSVLVFYLRLVGWRVSLFSCI